MRSEKEIRFGVAVAQLLSDSLNEDDAGRDDIALTKEALLWVLGEDDRVWFAEVVKDFRGFLFNNSP